MAKEFIISVDLGGTKILTAMLNKNKEIIERVKLATDISKGAANVVKSIAESVKQLLEKTGKTQNEIIAISMGVPGTVDPHTGIIGNAPNLGIRNYNIKNALQKNFQIPVLIENDVNLAALGIKKFEFNDNVKNMLVVFVGTGIGGALIFDGKLYRGSSFFAGEIGHMKVTGKGSLSGSATNSTFELLASRTAIVKAIRKDIRAKKRNGKDFSKAKIKSKVLAAAVKKNDRIVTRHINNSCEIIGTVLGSITTLLNIDTIVLGGGVLEALNKYMMPKIKAAYKKSVLPEPGKKVKIVATKLGDDAPLYGGISLAEEFAKKL
ncbi:MAG: ROK family protein [Bacteroidetes bacterium]|nr:ROK family protein [Bacteroidota bacterium]MBU1678281.1 ROK family protein [Bacteroidota bacterium]MBU2507655.1 ROK family protein [Bacteroidota bacterium]